MHKFQSKRWYPASLIGRLTCHTNHQAWLLDKGSLTKKLRQHCPLIRVEVIHEGFGPLFFDEAQALNLPAHHQAWIRQVKLICQDQPLIYARSVIPNFSIQNPWWRLKKLGQQPLGEVLFSQPHLARTEFEFCRANWLTPKTLARRCVFSQHQAPLLLTEVFLNTPTSQN
jgi:chorismate--pyruvate lyase